MNLITFKEWVGELGVSGMLDIAILGFLIYSALVWFKRTRTAHVLTGILIIAGFYLLVRQFDLVMTSIIFESFFAVFLVALVVIFQEELRSFFEKVAVWSTRQREFGRFKSSTPEIPGVSVITRAVADLAKEKIGALIVIKGRDNIERHIDGGIDLGGRLSAPLLMSIFDDSSAGHDGAVLVNGAILTKFACHLPLSRNHNEVGAHGTRHAAALGLAERCDVLCIVVSEEKGTISIAREGRMKKIAGAEELSSILDAFHTYANPVRRRKRPWYDFLKRNSKEKFISIILATALWFVNVHSSKIVYKTFTVPVSYVELPKEWIIKEIKPDHVELTFHARRSEFYFFKKDAVNLLVKLRQNTGFQRIRLYSENINFPKDFMLDQIDPLYVDFTLEKIEPPAKEKATESSE